MGNYSRGDEASLPSGVADLETVYDSNDLAAVVTAGDSQFATQTATDPQIPIHQYKDTVTAPTVDLTWTGQSDQDCADYPVTLQVYKFSTTTWEDLATNNTTTANNNFTLQKVGQVSSGYVDGSNVLTSRVYQKAVAAGMKSLWMFGEYGIYVSNSATNYMAVSGGYIATTELLAAVVIPVAGTISRLYITSVDGVPGAGKSYTFRVRKSTDNGASFNNTDITCSLSNSESSKTDTTNTVSVSAGDLITISSEPSGSPSGIEVVGGLTFTTASPGVSALMSGKATRTLSTSATEHISLAGISNVANVTETLSYLIVPVNGAISGLRVVLGTAPGADAGRTFTVRLNGTTDSIVDCTISNTDTIGNSGADSVNVSAGDRITIRSTIAAGTPAASTVSASVVFTASTNGQFILAQSPGLTTLSNSAARYGQVNQGLGPWSATTSTEIVKTVSTSFTAKSIYVGSFNDGAPGAGTKYTFALYDGGVTALAVDLSGTNETANASTDVSVTAADVIGLISTPDNSPTGIRVSISILGYITP